MWGAKIWAPLPAKLLYRTEAEVSWGGGWEEVGCRTALECAPGLRPLPPLASTARVFRPAAGTHAKALPVPRSDVLGTRNPRRCLLLAPWHLYGPKCPWAATASCAEKRDSKIGVTSSAKALGTKNPWTCKPLVSVEHRAAVWTSLGRVLQAWDYGLGSHDLWGPFHPYKKCISPFSKCISFTREVFT